MGLNFLVSSSDIKRSGSILGRKSRSTLRNPIPTGSPAYINAVEFIQTEKQKHVQS